MKKYILVFLITIILAAIPKVANAQARTFYEGEYIDGIYMNKLTPDRKTIYYQKARIFRDSSTNEYAYCIEPFSFFEDQAIYDNTNPYNLSNEQINEISLVAHFGYGYKNHTDKKWYAITQLLIWQLAEPNGTYYFTDSLNGNRINIYSDEINEIYNLISEYKKDISFNNTTYNIVEGETLSIKDTNNVLSSYATINEYTNITNNTLEASNLPLGKTIINLVYQDNYYNQPILFYQSYNSQNLVENGNINNKIANITINVQKTSIVINKLDQDTKTKENNGEAILDGAIYQLYDSDMNMVKELTIKDNIAKITNIKYGTYYIKEISPGIGYTLNTNTYELVISKDNPNIELDLYNEVIKAKLIINKEIETNKSTAKEANISFDIYDSNGKLIKTITTNELGQAEIELVYGKYLIKQVNSTEGYQFIEPFDIIVSDSNEIIFDLIDYKIPDTKTSLYKYIITIIKSFITNLLYE